MKKFGTYISRFTFVCKYMSRQPKDSDLVERFRKANEIYDNICTETIVVSGESIYINGLEKITIKVAEQKPINKMEALVVVNNLNEVDHSLTEDLHNTNAFEFVAQKLINNKLLMSSDVYDDLLLNNIELVNKVTSMIHVYKTNPNPEFIALNEVDDSNIEDLLSVENLVLFGADLIVKLSQYIDTATIVKSSVTPLQPNPTKVFTLAGNFDKLTSNTFGANNGKDIVAFHKTYKNMERKNKSKIGDGLVKQLLLNYYLNQ